MKDHRLSKLLPVLAICALAVMLAAQSTGDYGHRWWNTIKILADDNMEGRMTGSAGYLRAADYVADQMKKDGLQPAGTDGYRQPVKFEEQRVIADKCKVTLKGPNGAEPLVVGQDLVLPVMQPQPQRLSAGLVFVGYGLRIPSVGYDDFRGLDLKGKIVVAIKGKGPPNVPQGSVMSSAKNPQQLLSFLEKRGALGFIAIHNPQLGSEPPWPVLARLVFWRPGMWLADADLHFSAGSMLFAILNSAKADELLVGSGHTAGELLALADAGKPLPTFPLKATIEARIATQSEAVKSPNIIGVLPGSDPQLKSEYIVFSAHLDHLGIGEPIKGDRIYNGAMDNASGVASILEVARELHESGANLRRSVLFLVSCGEEEGLLGSQYFVAHPTVPRDRIAADLNLDIVLPLFPLKQIKAIGGDESSLGPKLREVAQTLGVGTVPDPHPEADGFIRSDQYSFIRAGIPAIFTQFGYDRGTPEETIESGWIRERYHHPSDDTNLKVDLTAAAQFNEIMRSFLVKVADDPDRPAWNASSPFRPGATQ